MTFAVAVGECVEISIGSSFQQVGQSTCVPVNIGQAGRVIVIGSQSLLDSSRGTNSSLTVTLYGNPGVTYDVLSTTNLINSNSWTTVASVTLTDLIQVINLGSATNQMQFFKAVQP